MKIEFYKHQLSEENYPDLKEALNSAILTSGPITEKFENSFARYFGVSRAAGVTSCAAALFLCLKSWGISHGDEVLVPAMTFVATPNAVLHTGATPVFVDIDPETGLIDLIDAERKITRNTRVIVPVHLYGQMVDMEAIRELNYVASLTILEDASHCIEGSHEGIKPAQFGDAACFSFSGVSAITCGEGGAVTTNHESLADTIKILGRHGLDKDAVVKDNHFNYRDMTELGYNYNMNDIQAALLLPQLENLASYHKRREYLYTYYISKLSEASLPITWPTCDPRATHAYHLFVIRVDSGLRDKLTVFLRGKGIGVDITYRAVHMHSYYRKHLGTKPGMCPHAEKMGDEVISLPFYPKLETKSIDYIVDVLTRFFEKEAV